MGQTFSEGVAIKTFDYSFASINGVTTSNVTNNSITLSVDAVDGENNIVMYYYSIDGESYIESNNNTYTFNNLLDNTEYTINVFVKDDKGYNSSIYTASIKTIPEINIDVPPHNEFDLNSNDTATVTFSFTVSSGEEYIWL